MWWLIWILLVLGALGAGALLVLRLWRQVKALGREVAGLGEAAERLSSAADEDQSTASQRYVPGALGEDRTLETARRTRERVKAARARQRQGRLDRSAARWRAAGLLQETFTPDVAG
ncbi:hypothetical protein [Georgenia subflava]|uniref:Uncharacterized protein n=1 Tax=Georgenia subflava TaxID=1622177 RepID=A0A6N7EUU2_9MICO|nr:hypothetical protein [Georgenia subflava]MPV38904.1 hypothetical protein [Georgenia subflava]